MRTEGGVVSYLFGLYLQQSRKRRIRGILYVSGDGLRVVDAENKV